MELHQIREKWTTIKVPAYSKEEIESIYSIKQASILSLVKSSLRLDLVVALILVVSFIFLLQILSFQNSNFWSLAMGFMAVQHLVIYLLQARLISKFSGYSGDVRQSLDTSITKLRRLQLTYRVLPVVLTVILILTYYWMFGPPLSSLELFGTLLAATLVVFGLSEFLSSRILKARIVDLIKIREDLR